MTKPQRIILAVYCLLLAYCCIWIPWRINFGSGQRQMTDVVYSLVWAVPSVGYDPGFKAVPEMKLILLRVVALTAICGTAFILVGLSRKPATRS